MKVSSNLDLDDAPLLTYRPFLKKVCLDDASGTFSMCLISIPIYVGPWKSLVKFGIKKSHEMISYILVGMTLLKK